LSVEEVAKACSISTDKVEKWLAQKILRCTKNGPKCIDVMDLLWFLLQHNMPVAPSLLPAKSLKVLFLARTVEELFENEEQADQICRILAETDNLVLAESTIIGRLAYLSVLTNKPDLAIIFQQVFQRESAETLRFLAEQPGVKIIFCGDVATKLALDNGLLDCPVNLTIDNNISRAKLREELNKLVTM
jgi:hypothetical protein